jgi:hypothetical protein
LYERRCISAFTEVFVSFIPICKNLPMYPHPRIIIINDTTAYHFRVNIQNITKKTFTTNKNGYAKPRKAIGQIYAGLI